MTDHKAIRDALQVGPVQYACHVDGDVDQSCSFDAGHNLHDCVNATRLSGKGLCKTDCAEWKPINVAKSTIEVSAANLRALLADLDEKTKALKYARRFLNAKDHDVAFVDAALKGAAHE